VILFLISLAVTIIQITLVSRVARTGAA